jgi:hypothetical protein
MTNINLDAIEARANAATQGPWWDDAYIGEDPYDDPDSPFVQVGTVRWGASDVEIPAALQQKRDAEFMAAAREDIPALIARVRELEEALARLLFSRTVTGMDWSKGEVEQMLRQANEALVGSSIPSLNKLDDLEHDNAALRLAATELYEFVTRGVGTDPSYGPVARMANVLGLSKEGE